MEKEIFNEFYSRCKGEIVGEFKSYYEYYKNNCEKKSNVQKKKYLELCELFLNKLININLPILTDDWWCYNFVLKNDSIDLVLSFCEDLEIKDGMVESATLTEEYILLTVKCEYISVSEFAKLCKVNEVTVRQWIRRGKIRSAKKQGRDWVIPSITSKPGRGFENVTYYWDKLSKKTLERFDFLNGYTMMHIQKDENNKSMYNLILVNSENCYKEIIQIDNLEREKLELELISSKQVRVEEMKIFHS